MSNIYSTPSSKNQPVIQRQEFTPDDASSMGWKLMQELLIAFGLFFMMMICVINAHASDKVMEPDGRQSITKDEREHASREWLRCRAHHSFMECHYKIGD